MQKGIFVVLVLIAFLLGANLFKSSDVHAAKKYQYIVVSYQFTKNLQDEINKVAAQGYEYIDNLGDAGYFVARK